MPVPRWKRGLPEKEPEEIETEPEPTEKKSYTRWKHEEVEEEPPIQPEPKPEPIVTEKTKYFKKQEEGVTPEAKLHFIRSITGHGKENIPEEVKALGPSAEREYAVTAYKTQRGIIPPERGREEIQSKFETRLKTGSKPTSIRWMKQYGTFTSDEKEYTWSELKTIESILTHIHNMVILIHGKKHKRNYKTV